MLALEELEMLPDIRDFIARLEEAGELIRITKPVDPLHISALLSKTDKAVYMERVIGYDMPVTGGLCRDTRKLAIGLGVPHAELSDWAQQKLAEGPIPPIMVDEAPCQEVVMTGDDVDLTALPYTFQHESDGGPYIGSAIQYARDPEYGDGAGIYRHMFRTKNSVGIDWNSPSDMRLFYTRALRKGKGLPIAVSIGNGVAELAAAATSLPTGVSEMGFAGRMHGRPVEMVKCLTNDLAVPANSEIVFEGEVLPGGWQSDEGRYGEFHRASGEVKWNPIVKINAITRRRNPIFYSLIMPFEAWGMGVLGNTNLYKVLRDVGVQPVAMRSRLFDLVVSIKEARPGQGKTAATALLACFMQKTVTVVDDDIDVFDDDMVKWAIALRFQPDKDLVVVSGLPAKHMDVSAYTWNLPPGQLPTTSKMGIDATIKPDMPKVYFERPRYFLADEVDAEAYYGSPMKRP